MAAWVLRTHHGCCSPPLYGIKSQIMWFWVVLSVFDWQICPWQRHTIVNYAGARRMNSPCGLMRQWLTSPGQCRQDPCKCQVGCIWANPALKSTQFQWARSTLPITSIFVICAFWSLQCCISPMNIVGHMGTAYQRKKINNFSN